MTQQGINDELYSNALSKFSPQQAPNFGFTSYVRNYAVGDINIANGSVCYIDLTNTAYRAMADSAAHCSGILGIAQGPNPGVGQPMSFLALGYWNNSQGFIVGQAVYLSDTVWGGLQQNAPTNPLSVTRSVGYTSSYGILSFNLGGLGVMPGPTGLQGIPGVPGATGPNAISTATTTPLNGLIQGNGTNISGAVAPPSTLASVSHKWLNAYSASTGLFTQTQPAFSDISGVASTAQIPSLSSYYLPLSGGSVTGPLISLGLVGPHMGSGSSLAYPYDYTGMSYVVNDNNGGGFFGIWSQGSNYMNFGCFDNSGMCYSRFAMGDAGDRTISYSTSDLCSFIIGGYGGGFGASYFRSGWYNICQMGDGIGGVFQLRAGLGMLDAPSGIVINQGISAYENYLAVYDNNGSVAFAVGSSGTDSVVTVNNTLDDGHGNSYFGGNMTVAANLNASAFIVPSGMPTQFLKADGSTDSSTYLPYKSKGTVTLVSGTKAVTISGVTSSNQAWVTVSVTGGTLGTTYKAVCTTNTLTITSVSAAGTTVATDTSTLNYLIV